MGKFVFVWPYIDIAARKNESNGPMAIWREKEKSDKSKSLLARPKWPLTPSRPKRFSKTLHNLRKLPVTKKVLYRIENKELNHVTAGETI